VDPTTPGAGLLPQVADLRSTSVAVAAAVVRTAQREGVAGRLVEEPAEVVVAEAMWQPEYHPVRAV
jgi:malate dehydrogenase (oxaloacetate-decarboxylating)